MSTRPLISHFLARKASGVITAAFVILAFSIPSLRAQTITQAQINGQNALNYILQNPPVSGTGVKLTNNVNSVTAPTLALAVSYAITAGTSSYPTVSSTTGAISPADLAVGALLPQPATSGTGKVRTDLSTTSGPEVAEGAIYGIFQTTDASFATDTASVVDNVMDLGVGGTNTKLLLTLAGQETVLKDSIGAVSDAAIPSVTSTTSAQQLGATALNADTAIGTAIANDAHLQGLASSGLTTILQIGIEGITGDAGTSQAVAAQSAENFVQGVLSTGTIPNGPQPATSAGYATFAVNILKNVATNTAVDELVAYRVGLTSNTQLGFNNLPGLAQSNLVTLGTSLYAKYTTAPEAVKITQGVTASSAVTDGTDTGRAALVGALTLAKVADAASIVEGAAYTDPFYTGTFTGASFNAILHATATTGTTTLRTDSTAIATGLGNVLGQDGNVLTNVADVYRQYLSTGVLLATSAATYVTDLISGAVKSTVPATQFTGNAAGGGGGTLNVGVGVTANTVNDLASVADLIANGFLTYDATVQAANISGTTAADKTALTTAAGQLKALATAVATFTKNETFVPPNSSSQSPVGLYLAGTLAKDVSAFITSLNLGASSNPAFTRTLLNNIESGIEAGIGPTTVIANLIIDNQITAMFNNQTFSNFSFTNTGSIVPSETPVTNL